MQLLPSPLLFTLDLLLSACLPVAKVISLEVTAATPTVAIEILKMLRATRKL